MNIANKIEYIAADKSREVIPWVRATNAKSEATIYQAETEAPIDSTQIRVMDCIDCHNRPTHIFKSAGFGWKVHRAVDDHDCWWRQPVKIGCRECRQVRWRWWNGWLANQSLGRPMQSVPFDQFQSMD